MRKLIYVVGNKETTSYKEARQLQPTGQLQTRLEIIEEKKTVTRGKTTTSWIEREVFA